MMGASVPEVRYERFVQGIDVGVSAKKSNKGDIVFALGVPLTCVLIVTVLLVLIVDDATAPRKTWRIHIIRPDGVLHSSGFIKSRWRPRVCSEKGGQTTIDSISFFGQRTEYTAPTGWLIECEQDPEPDEFEKRTRDE